MHTILMLTASAAATTVTPRPWSLFTQVGYTQSVVDNNDGRDVSSSSGGIKFTYQFKNKITMNAGIQIQYDNHQRSRQEVSQSDVSLSTSYIRTSLLNKSVYYAPTLLAAAPTSEVSRNNSLISAATVINNFSLNTTKYNLSRWSLSNALSFSRRFYKYIESAYGGINVKHIYSNSLSVGYKLVPKWHLGIKFSYHIAENFSGYQTESFSISESLSYTVTKKISALLVHSNGGLAYRPNHLDSNIQLFDEHSSIYYLALAWEY